MRWPWQGPAPPVEHDECEVCRSSNFLVIGTIVRTHRVAGVPTATAIGTRQICEVCETMYRQTQKGLQRVRPHRVVKDEEEGPAAAEKNGHEPEGLDTDLAAPRTELKLRGLLDR